MKPILTPTLAALALAGCVAPRAPAPPPPPPAPVVEAPPPAPQPAWLEAPLTAGDWRYDHAAREARFGDGLFAMRCDPAARTVTLSRAGGSGPLRVTVTDGARALAAAVPGGTGATLAASDPFLDRIVFSRGRFMVEAGGTERLIMPSWAEVARVVEECRG